MQRKPALINTRRRTLIKFGLFGAAAFALGKVLGPSLNFLGSEELTLGDGKTFNFKNFRVIENGEELGFYDQSGKEILVMDKSDVDSK